MRVVTGRQARATIAKLLLGPLPSAARLGEIALHQHQTEGVATLRRLIDQHRGALLADEVGLGKTFTALAVARGRAPLIVAPASLRQSWLDAARRADVSVRFASMETLSRDAHVERQARFIIVDEAHHFRNPSTRRYARLAALARDAHVLLLSATPVQNQESDLRVPLSLFLGEAAHAMPLEELRRLVVRRTSSELDAGTVTLPAIMGTEWLPAVEDTDCLDAILALPEPVPPRGGEVAVALNACSLARQWSSSRAALREALRRRVARGYALLDALLAGRVPTRADMRAWVFADGAQQLAFSELLVPANDATPDTLAELHGRVQAHVQALERLTLILDASPDPDVARAAQLRRVLDCHPGCRVVAFSEYTATVSSLFRQLMRDRRVAMLTHSGGRVAGGPVTRREVVSRFAPGAGDALPAAERIDLLITTDVLSEGVGLHDASVVVHLDLAWNPARLEQRVGRLRRIGAPASGIAVYAMRPPVATERLLRMEERLRTKLREASRTVGLAGAILPVREDPPDGLPEVERRIQSILSSWRGDALDEPVVAAVRAGCQEAILCVRRGDEHSLVVIAGDRIVRDRLQIEHALRAASADETELPARELSRLVTHVEEHWRRGEVGQVVDITTLRLARSRRSMLRRVEGISRRVPRHSQPRLATLVHTVRAAATATMSAGAERVLDELVHAQMGDEAWLQAMGQFAELHARGPAADARIVALLLLVR